MIGWGEFETVLPRVAAAARRLLERNEVAFLATVSSTGRPRIHPFVPRVIDGRLMAFITRSSPKIRDLIERRQFSVHLLPGNEDEEVCLSGEAIEVDSEPELRRRAANLMGFATGVDESHVLFELLLDRALHTQWLGFGTPDHRPSRTVWRL